MDNKEREYELERLSMTIEHIKRQLAASGSQCTDSQQQLKGTLADYWGNLGSSACDEAQFIEEMDRQKKLTALVHQKYSRLQRMADSPYFGRIDFWEPQSGSDQAELIYIGISSLSHSGSGELLVYDWRSPVAGMFYDFERGKAWYECPAGRIEGEIRLKRQFKIVNGIMKYMFDADITIEDEMLQAVLSKSSDARMHTIVTSIQREQNQIVRDVGHPVLFVRGPAGSGKTSIALHRIAYLLYHEREHLSSKNVIIFSPNHIFSDYIADVLPEIGEENVLQTTFQDYVKDTGVGQELALEDRSVQLEWLLGDKQAGWAMKVENIRYKSSAAFVKLLDCYVGFLQETLVREHPPIRFNGEVIFSKGEWKKHFFHNLAHLPAGRRLKKIRQLIKNKLQSAIQRLRQEKIKEITESGNEVNAKTVEAMARLAAGEAAVPLYEIIHKLTELHALSLYKALFTCEEFLNNREVAALLPQTWQEICRQTLRELQAGRVTYEDSFGYLYLLGMLEGFPANREIRHVVVDEAQDYTALQYKIIKQLFPASRWTILGDPAQAVHPYLTTADFAEVSRILQQAGSCFYTLKRAYRSTCEIHAFCQALLPATEKTEAVLRFGGKPRVVRQRQADGTNAWLRAVQVLQREGWQSIALICKTARQAMLVHQAVSERLPAHVILSEDDRFRRGVVVIPSYLAKGLEFDAVLVVQAEQTQYGRPEERNLFYTVCTRALHQLCLFHFDALTPFVAELDTSLYDVMWEENN